MPNLRFAEFLLSLVMPTGRAAAVAGDLAESSSGAFALWLAVMRTLLVFCFRSSLTCLAARRTRTSGWDRRSVFVVCYRGLAARKIS
jgi:hypothetical protein